MNQHSYEEELTKQLLSNQLVINDAIDAGCLEYFVDTLVKQGILTPMPNLTESWKINDKNNFEQLMNLDPIFQDFFNKLELNINTCLSFYAPGIYIKINNNSLCRLFAFSIIAELDNTVDEIPTCPLVYLDTEYSNNITRNIEHHKIELNPNELDARWIISTFKWIKN